jgi:hypothetical protein
MTRLAHCVFDDSLLAAWKAATSWLANDATDHYVLVTSFGDAWAIPLGSLSQIDAQAKACGFEMPSSVAAMLCPRVVRRTTGSVTDAIEAGQKLFGRGRTKRLRFSSWQHTYFERLTGKWYDRFGNHNFIKDNKLLQAIEKLNRWPTNAEASLYLHTDAPSDTFRVRGNPCLQYVQIRAYGDHALSIAALYRSHDYSNKALGNFVGLRELGKFIAERSGRRFTGCEVISLHPFIGTKSRTNEFIAGI